MPAASFSSSSSLTAPTSSMDGSSSSSSMAAETDAAAVSSSSDWKYVVFLSFRGEDTRNTFTGHLYMALDQKGIDTFMDDKKLRTGDEISPTLVTAIQRSRCSIIVLSENYASSKWCLEELVEILECKRTKNQRVVPIFYNVDPSHVRNQTGSFGEALSKHEGNLKIKGEKVRKWREALTQVANLSGLHSLNKSEAQLIEEIVVDISKDLNCALSKDTRMLVGVDSCIRELESLLHLESLDVRMIGIWGMGGIGKTTLARVIYEKNFEKFDGCCFLGNVGDLAKNGEDYLKKELLSRVLRDKNIDVTITSVEARLHSKKVLIVIDDVNHRSILKTLAGELNWFGLQSRIIVTTRDKQFLTMHGVNAIYEVQKLQVEKAIELFNHYAFRNHPPSRDVFELIPPVIAYAQGLPLALEVLGSFLCNKSKDEWVCALNKLKKIPDMEIQKVLQISFDELDDDQKSIFLDIAFVFSGWNRDLITEILNSCGFSSFSGIRTLIDKSLISIIDDELHMHDLLVAMGKEIVRQTSPKEPGKRSRLWMQQDIYHVLEKNTGTEEIEVIVLNLSGLKEIRFTTEAFAKMTKLRLLEIRSSSHCDDFECSSGEMQCKVHLSDDFRFQSDELRFLSWDECPLKSLPSDFISENLVFLSISNSHVTQLWEGNKACENLKFMALNDSKYLTETPDFSRVTNLEYLGFEGCTQLCKIHPSLAVLDKLTELGLENCINLEHFPGLGQLASLKILSLSGCSKLQKSPDLSQHIPCLSELHLDGTVITELPSSIGYSTQLVLLDLKDCIKLQSLPSSICKLTLLETLSLSGCSELQMFPDISQHMPCLSELYLDETAITELPSSIGYATQLVVLDLKSCTRLRSLPSSISKLTLLETLSLSGCSELQKFPDISQHMPCLSNLYLDGTAITELPSSIVYATQLVLLELKNCRKLQSIPSSICELTLLETLSLSGCSELKKFPDISQHMPCLSKLYLDGTAITELPSSIVYATQLVVLDLENCRKLQSLPSNICKLARLETLSLSGCSELQKFPDISQHMACLSKLYLDGTAITELPSSIRYATQLAVLDLKNCRELRSLPSCICIGKREVNSGNLDALPRTLGGLCSLQRLELQNCRSLPALPALPSSLELVNASNCESLEDIAPQSDFLSRRGSMFANCFKLTKYRSMMERDLLSMATHADKKRWRSTYKERYPYVPIPFSTVIPGRRIPDWFKHRSEGHEINIKVSPNWYSSNFLGFAVSAILAPEKRPIRSGWCTYCDLGSRDLNLKLESNRLCSFFDSHFALLEDTTIGSDHVWLAYIPSFFGFNCEKRSQIKFSFDTSSYPRLNVKRCGISPVYINCSSDEGNPSGSVPDDLHELGEDSTMGRSPEEAESRGSVQEDTIIRSLDDTEPRGIGYSCINPFVRDQEILLMTSNPHTFQFSNAHYIPQMNPSGLAFNNLYEWILEDAMARRSLHEVLEDLLHSVSLDTMARWRILAWDQERFERQLHPYISNNGINSWVFITIFSFLFLAHVFYRAPFRIPPLLGAPFWISPLVAAPFGISTLVAAPFEISTFFGAPYDISTLLGGVVLLFFIFSRL